MRIAKRLAWVACGFSTLMALGCGSATGTGTGEATGSDGVEAIGTSEQPLLLTPGAFYTTAPHFGFCSAAAPSISDVCHPGYSFNSAPGAASYTRLAAGVYSVAFPGLSHGGNAQAVAVGSNAHCAVSNVAPNSGNELVQIVCRDPSGLPVDTRFTVSYYRDTNVGGILGGYALVRNTAPLTVVDTWNSTGSPVLASTSGVGAYRVIFPGQVLGADTALVTAASGSLSAHCKILTWSSLGSSVAVDVRCFNFGGAPANADFSVSYGRNIRGEPRNSLPTGTQGGFSLVNAPGGVQPTFSKNSCPAGINSATKIGAPFNYYQEKFFATGASLHSERPAYGFVTAQGTGANYCNLDFFAIQKFAGTPSEVYVKCFAANGASVADTPHVTMFMLQDAKGC